MAQVCSKVEIAWKTRKLVLGDLSETVENSHCRHTVLNGLLRQSRRLQGNFMLTPGYLSLSPGYLSLSQVLSQQRGHFPDAYLKLLADGCYSLSIHGIVFMCLVFLTLQSQT